MFVALSFMEETRVKKQTSDATGLSKYRFVLEADTLQPDTEVKNGHRLPPFFMVENKKDIRSYPPFLKKKLTFR